MEEKEININFPTKSQKLIMPIFSKTYIHWGNGHRIKATNYDSPAPWLGNAIGEHPKSYSFIQAYCITCEENGKGIIYLNRFDTYNGKCEEEPMSETEVRKEVDEFIN